MITTVADLINEFRLKEKEVLDDERIKHGPIIGAMYEGLTKEVLDQSSFDGMDLRVTSGFIEYEGKRSAQIDCMLVKGSGRSIPYTDNHIYNVTNVVAIVEVKKTLYKNELIDAYHNLNSIQSMRSPEAFDFDSFECAYESIMYEPVPSRTEISKLPLWKQHIYHALIAENILPARIVLGYSGFASEYNFRQAIADFMDDNLGETGFGPVNFPNLIISSEYSVVKMNGFPYSSPISDNCWPFLASYSGNPMLPFLEIIWSRLSYKFGLPSAIFGSDTDVEVMKHFMKGRAILVKDKPIWECYYAHLTKEELASRPVKKPWAPFFLSEPQAIFFGDLLIHDVSVHDSKMNQVLAEYGTSIKDVVSELNKNGLAAIDGTKIVALTRQGRLGCIKETGQWIAGEDSNGRFGIWIKENHGDFGLYIPLINKDDA